MAARCKGFNSKCFLLTYLIIVGLLVFLWMNRSALMNEDKRDIPIAMLSYLESPPRLTPSVELNVKNKLVLTNEFYLKKWTFTYFTHLNCMPDCQLSLDTLKRLNLSFSNSDFQFLVIDIDAEAKTKTIDGLAGALLSRGYDFTVASTSAKETKKLANFFGALYLRTDYKGGSYQIEQEQNIFLIDPKGRVYATFHPPYEDILSQAHATRYFYARTE